MTRSADAIRLLPLSSNTHALLAIDGPAAATFNTIVEAVTEGGAGNLVTLELAAGGTWVPSIGTLTLAGNAVDGETVTIGTTVYRWKDTLAAAYDVKIGANAAASIVNLVAAINANGTAGTHYFAGTLVHPTVRAIDGAGDTVVVQTNSDTILTAVGTLIATTETMTQGSWAAATLADGTDGDNVVFTAVGTAVSCVFSSGYTSVADFEAELAATPAAAALLRVKTAGTTPHYRLVVTDDDFTATAMTGGGVTTVSAPTYNDAEAGRAAPFYANEALCLVRSVAGSGTMTGTVSIRGYSKALGQWFLIGTLNGGSAIGETATDRISYAELLVGVGGFSRFAATSSVGGTATELEVWLDFIRPGAHD